MNILKDWHPPSMTMMAMEGDEQSQEEGGRHMEPDFCF